MRLAFTAAALALFTAATLPAQSSHGYVFLAPGGLSSAGRTQATLHGGGGFEAMVWRRWVGAGAEAGWIGPTERLDAGLGSVSANGYFHAGGDRLRGIDPFVTAGYTMFFRSGTENLVNFGGGLNWWIRDNVGLKFELRDHVAPERFRTAHFWGFRFGVTFR